MEDATLTDSVVLDNKTKHVTIKELTIHDPALCQILSDIEPGQYEGFLRTAILIGAIGLRNMVVAENVDYVEKEFSQILHKLEMQQERTDTRMGEIFNINDESAPLGALVRILANYFDADKGVVANLLDPNRPESPLHKLREDLTSRFDEVTRHLTVHQKVEEVVSSTPLKGAAFEVSMGEELAQITNSYGDCVEYVGEKRGRRGKKGDYVVLVNDDKEQAIVVECKDSLAYTHDAVTKEIAAAMENRKAQFGIFLFKSADQIPKQMRPVRIARNSIITCFEGNGLYYAYRIARMVLKQAGKADTEDISVDEIQEHLFTISEKCEIIGTMQSKITTIENAARYLRGRLGELETTIEDCLINIRSCLVSSS